MWADKPWTCNKRCTENSIQKLIKPDHLKRKRLKYKDIISAIKDKTVLSFSYII